MTKPIKVGDKLVRIQIFEVTDDYEGKRHSLFRVRSGGQPSDVGERWLREHTTPLSAEFAEVLENAGWLK